MSDQPARDVYGHWGQTRNRDGPEQTESVPGTLSAQEAARLLGVHERTVRRAIGRGELSATKQGGSFHINAEELERYRQYRARPLRHHIATRLHALPESPTSFVGRNDLVAEVVARLRGHDVRLVTLTGPGGTGKTRLALRVAATCAAHFANGAAFVSLAPVHEAELVVPTIAQVLGVRETEDQSPKERLHTFLRDRELLLVLDNLEQVLEAGPALGQLLATCPRLTILATSRAPLRLGSERVYHVPPLALPLRRTAVGGATELPSYEQLVRTEAIQLFVERATAASGDFGLTSENADDVAAICERVNGLPLAIELAAARSRVLMPADLLARLSPQLPLLTGGPADQPPRLRSMADAIAWSHDLLTRSEQALFRRLAIFVGGFGLEAAEAVGGRCNPPPPSILETLTALVDQSLVQRSTGPGHETRFSLLEPVREFGLERLAASGEEAPVRDAHANWCLAFAERAQPELAGPQQEAWFDRLEAEHPNMRAALGWLRERGDAERGLLLASKLSWFWSSRGYLREARAWFDQFLTMPTSATTRGIGLLEAVTILQWQGDDERALVLNEEAIRIFRELGDERNSAAALRSRASIAIDRGDHEQAAALLAESSEVLLSIGIPWDRPFALYLAGRVAAVAGKNLEAMSRFAEAAAAFREVGDFSYVAAALARQGAAAIGSGDLLAARAAYATALELAHERNEPVLVALSLAGAAHLAHAAGEPAAAARLLGAAAAIREMIGERTEPDAAPTDAIQNALGEKRYAEEWRLGMELPVMAVIAEARAILTGSIRRARSSRRERSRQSLPLTAREREVLRLVVDGLSDKEIAAVLAISHSTASDHVASIRAKLGVPSRAAASALAVRSGLLFT